MRKARGLLVAPPISFLILGYILQKSIAVVLVIYAATIMLKPVADNQIIHVVAGNLVENLLGDFYFRRLVFHNHPGGKVASIEHCITAFLYRSAVPAPHLP